MQGSLSVGVIGPVGEALFLYIDELAAACAEGFARASAEVAGELERRRRRLLDLIVTDPPVSRRDHRPGPRGGLAVPRKVAVVALEDRSQDHFGPLPALPPDVLVDMTRQDPCLLVPDPDGPGRADMIERGLRGWTGAFGPVVPLGRAGCSLRWARPVLALGRRGAIRAGRGLIRCEEHLTSLVLLSDEELARVLSSVWLAPLARLRPSQQDIIAETLLAWLQNAATPGSPRPSCMCIRRRSATGCARSRSCSAPRWPSRPRASTWRSRCAPASCFAARLGAGAGPRSVAASQPQRFRLAAATSPPILHM